MGKHMKCMEIYSDLANSEGRHVAEGSAARAGNPRNRRCGKAPVRTRQRNLTLNPATESSTTEDGGTFGSWAAGFPHGQTVVERCRHATQAN